MLDSQYPKNEGDTNIKNTASRVWYTYKISPMGPREETVDSVELYPQ